MRAWRRRMNLTQRQAAAALCMSPRHYRRIEAKPGVVTRATARLCQFIEQEHRE